MTDSPELTSGMDTMAENVSLATVENRVEVAAIAMMNAEREVRGRHGLVFTDCRVLARLALEAVDALSTAPASPVVGEDVSLMIKMIRQVAARIKSTAENLSPINGASGGSSYPAPEMRRYASQIEGICNNHVSLNPSPTPIAARERGLEEALKPFANMAAGFKGDPDILQIASSIITDDKLFVGDLRRAERALITPPQPPHDPDCERAGRAEALEDAANIAGVYANLSATGDEINIIRNTARNIATKIRALSSAPTPQAVTVDDEAAIDRAVIAIREHILSRDEGFGKDRLAEPIEEEEREFVRIVRNALRPATKTTSDVMVDDAAKRRHTFVPDKKYPWFCGSCGYVESEPLQHAFPQRREE